MTSSKRLTVSARGQITIPKAMIKALNTSYLECSFDGKKLTLEPMQTREEFFEELDTALEDYKKNGGLTVEQVRKEYGL